MKAGEFLCQIESETEPAHLERLQPDGGINNDLQDFLGRFCGDLLDVHPAGLARHDDRAFGGAVDDHAEIQLARDVARILDEHALDEASLGACLVSDEVHSDDRVGGLLGLVR